MIYADVLVDTKTSSLFDSFTYAMTPEQLPKIKIGSRVLVPFRQKKQEGMVLALSKTKSSRIKNIKPILKILETGPVINEAQLKLARWISEYYYATLASVVFTMVPPVARRISIQPPRLMSITTSGVGGKVHQLFGGKEKRDEIYLKLIKKALEKNKNVIIIFPEIGDRRVKNFQKIFSNKILFWHSTQKTTEKYLNWLKIKTGQAQVVIGTRSTIFAPLPRLGLIIIDQPEDFTYKQEQSPRYHAVKVAEKISQLSGINLVLGDILPSIERYYSNRKNWLSQPGLNKYSNILENVRIISERGWLGYTVENAIEETLKQKGKILIFLNHKGEGIYYCPDCNHQFTCQNCDQPLIYYKNYLYCSRCQKKTPQPAACPECRSVNLRAKGLGIDKLKYIASKVFPKAKIDYLQENRYPASQLDILIATKAIFNSNFETKYDLVVALDPDFSLSLPDFRQQEEVFRLLIGLSQMANRLIIKTNQPDLDLYQYFHTGDWEKFYKKELAERKALSYPPFSQLVRLVYQNISEEKCKIESEKLSKSLNNYTSKSLSLLGPSPCFYPKNRNRYRYQIVIKLKTKNEKLKSEVLKKIPPTWKIDVDPNEFL